MTFASNFERIKYYHEKGWATKSQVAQYVAYGVITPEEYELITGDEYDDGI